MTVTHNIWKINEGKDYLIKVITYIFCIRNKKNNLKSNKSYQSTCHNIHIFHKDVLISKFFYKYSNRYCDAGICYAWIYYPSIYKDHCELWYMLKIGSLYDVIYST